MQLHPLRVCMNWSNPDSKLTSLPLPTPPCCSALGLNGNGKMAIGYEARSKGDGSLQLSPVLTVDYRHLSFILFLSPITAKPTMKAAPCYSRQPQRYLIPPLTVDLQIVQHVRWSVRMSVMLHGPGQ
jgi:hypothetical protein